MHRGIIVYRSRIVVESQLWYRLKLRHHQSRSHLLATYKSNCVYLCNGQQEKRGRKLLMQTL